MVDKLIQMVIVNVSDEEVLCELDLYCFDVVLIVIGEYIEVSVLCIMYVIFLEVREVWVKVIMFMYYKIVEKFGVSWVFYFEYEMGLCVVQFLVYFNMFDYISLGDNYFVIEICFGEVFEDWLLFELCIDDKEVCLLVIKYGQSVSLNLFLD